DMDRLYAQHTEETGQVFRPEAVARAWDMTLGQPWLVNALAYQACFENKEGRDRTRPVTAEDMEEAAEQLILSRTTHLDQLADKLQEDRVRSVIEPILSGENGIQQIPTDDLQYVEDLGLIRLNPFVRIANPIYQEVIPREITFSEQRMIPQETAWYVGPDGRLNMEKLLARFQQYYRENVDAWLPGFSYREVGPQLLLQAFMQGIVNGGGRIHREYALGRDRTDLLVLWRGLSSAPHPDFFEQRIVIEMKTLRKSLDRTISDGLEQTSRYMDTCGGSEGHLVIFDRTPGKTWEEKLFREERQYASRIITVWGM
ncbi:MAG TPA: ATP-binding protein, partial [Armatimonadota bacterium]|nr:ATP-binding protein [Armatimonadota bacterium]